MDNNSTAKYRFRTLWNDTFGNDEEGSHKDKTWFDGNMFIECLKALKVIEIKARTCLKRSASDEVYHFFWNDGQFSKNPGHVCFVQHNGYGVKISTMMEPRGALKLARSLWLVNSRFVKFRVPEDCAPTSNGAGSHHQGGEGTPDDPPGAASADGVIHGGVGSSPNDDNDGGGDLEDFNAYFQCQLLKHHNKVCDGKEINPRPGEVDEDAW
jgi:hypothetical protein